VNEVLLLLRTARASSGGVQSIPTEKLLEEILRLHEEMIEQLLIERLGVVACSDFIAGIIEQHEKAAADIRLRLENRRVDLQRKLMHGWAGAGAV
jgi:hypothetical protein